MTPAAFIDRDGVINEERAYLHRRADFVLLPELFTVQLLSQTQTLTPDATCARTPA